MRQGRLIVAMTLSGLALTVSALVAGNPDVAARGEKALTGRPFSPPSWPVSAYHNAWRQWNPATQEKPLNYAEAFRDHYGLHAPPYPNGDYPMGLREASLLLNRGLATDCLLCHGGSIAGQSYIGLGNTSLDIQTLFEDMAAASGRSSKLPFHFGNVRGTSEAGAIAVYLLGWRKPNLELQRPAIDLGIHDDLCEDVPAWWLLKKKKTMYYTGASDARSVRSLMQFMMSPLTTAATFAREEATFADIREFLLSLKPPKYPFAIDPSLARKGERLFVQNCSKCHGTYGEKWTYPNRIVPLDDIGTDPNRLRGITREFEAYYAKSWFGREKPGWLADEYVPRATHGYQAPPLDGIWATAPYLHNGSVPTVYHVLDSSKRPKVFTRSYRTDREAYDPARLGWKVQVLKSGADPRSTAFEQRKIYDTRLPGRSNRGHTFGDHLSEQERMAVIEYLKTL